MAMVGHDAELVYVAEARRPSVLSEDGKPYITDEKHQHQIETGSAEIGYDKPRYENEPSEDDYKNLRRISGKIPWTVYTVTFVEFCERFSYYGTTVVFVNFIQQSRPYGSPTGAINLTEECLSRFDEATCSQPGGLGQGQQASTGLVTFDAFWAYFMPLVGGYVADTYLGRFAVSTP